jgi:hypothetical protein
VVEAYLELWTSQRNRDFYDIGERGMTDAADTPKLPECAVISASSA